METFKNKEAYWFSHDSNAKDDPKCMLLIDQLGAEGYGIFWILVESLREQPDFKYPLMLLPILAKRYGTTTEKMTTVVLKFKLFEVENDEFFYSNSLNNRMKALGEKREKARQNVLKRWNKTPKNTPLLPPYNDSNTIKEDSIIEDNSKVNNTKINFTELENPSWFENIIRMVDFKIDLDELYAYWTKFKIELEAKEDLYRTKEDYRRHFPAWVKIQIEKAKDSTGKSTFFTESGRQRLIKKLSEYEVRRIT